MGSSIVGILLLVFGILVSLAGVGMLVAASLAAEGTATFNHACAMNPVCSPAPDISGSFTAAGVVMLLVGIGLVVFGVIEYQKSPS